MSLGQDPFNVAIQLHQNGRIGEAIAIYKKLFATHSGNHQYLYLLGTAYLQTGKVKESVELLTASLKLNRSNLEALKNLGIAQLAAENPSDALKTFNSLVKSKPSLPEAHFNQANALKKLGKLSDALNAYERAIKLKPNYIEALYNRGNLLMDQGKLEDALNSYQKVIDFAPKVAEAHNNKGSALKQMKRFEEALQSFEIAVSCKPQFPSAQNNIGAVLNELKRFDEALLALDKAVTIDSDNAEIFNNKGVAHKELKQYPEAQKAFEKAITLKSDYENAYINLGNLFKELKQMEPALSAYNRAIEINSDSIDGHFFKGLLQLMMGDLKEGWELYEWRHKADLQGVPFSPDKPLWNIKDAPSYKRILVHGEQGIGDQIMFASLLKELKSCCNEVLVRLDERLIPLFERSFGKGFYYISNKEEVKQDRYDACVSMGSLCKEFRMNEEDFSGSPYLLDDEIKTSKLREQLRNQKLENEKIVGISWKSSNEKSGDKRSLNLVRFLQGLDLDNVVFANLQYGEVADEIKQAETELNITFLNSDSVDNKEDIDGLASLIQCCDLVISIDNSTVHLAGALGKEVHTLLPVTSDWR